MLENRKTVRITNIGVLELIEQIKNDFSMKSENKIINDALKIGLPIYIKQLKKEQTLFSEDDDKAPSTDFYMRNNQLDEIINTLEQLKENQMIQMAVQEIDEAMLASTYSRLKYFISTAPYSPIISDVEDAKMDFRIPSQYKEKKEEYITQVLTSEKEGEKDE